MSDIPHSWVDQSFDESVLLFHYIIKVLDRSELSSFTEEFERL